MADYRKILKRAGWVLVIVGLADIGYMIYCIANSRSYQSSFNIFAVVAGIFLLKGSLKAARIISMLTAFMIACFLGIMLLIPLLFPFDLLLAYLKLKPVSIGLELLIYIAIILFLIWLYRSLTSASVRAAMDESQINYSSFWRRPKMGFWIGGSGVILLFVFLFLLMGGETADKAKEKAAAQTGPGYKFYVNNLNISSSSSGKQVHAVVTAYNNDEIKELVIEWSE
jgi:hypothetical protein